MIDLSYSFCNLFALLFKVSYFICGICRWLIWLLLYQPTQYVTNENKLNITLHLREISTVFFRPCNSFYRRFRCLPNVVRFSEFSLHRRVNSKRMLSNITILFLLFGCRQRDFFSSNASIKLSIAHDFHFIHFNNIKRRAQVTGCCLCDSFPFNFGYLLSVQKFH